MSLTQVFLQNHHTKFQGPILSGISINLISEVHVESTFALHIAEN